MRVLFICKKGQGYGPTTQRKSSGLYNSTQFIVRALRANSIPADIVEVTDNNDIDREVKKHRATICVIEALWVVPEKFVILKKLHPRTKFFVHLHSEIPFLALEGNAIHWLIEYAKREVGTIVNSSEAYEALARSVSMLHFLPNVYLSDARSAKLSTKAHLDIACFGAIRPMKNHLTQALAAIEYARQEGKSLRFHINTARVEGGGAPVLKNLRHLFKETPDAELIEHPWFEPRELINFLQKNIDIGMQVSLTETFNVVTADYITAGIPIVVSEEISWVSDFCKTDGSFGDIVSKLRRVNENRLLVGWNQILLERFASKSTRAWVEFCASL